MHELHARCCPLLATPAFTSGPLAQSFGTDRFPCCAVHGGHENNNGSDSLRLLDRLTNNAVIVVGDSVARQYAIALLCAIEIETGQQPELHGHGLPPPSRAMQTKLNPAQRELAAIAIQHGGSMGSTIVAIYPSFNLTILMGKGSAYFPAVFKAAARTPVVQAILVGGGLSELGHHWDIFPACRTVAKLTSSKRSTQSSNTTGSTDNISIVSSSLMPLTEASTLATSVAACRDAYAEKTASMLSGIVDTLGCRRCIHMVSTSPQHFPTSDGQFHSPATPRSGVDLAAPAELARTDKRLTFRKRDDAGAHNYTCMPLAKFQDSWRNEALRRAAGLAGVHYHDSLRLMGHMWDAHVGSKVVPVANTSLATGVHADNETVPVANTSLAAGVHADNETLLKVAMDCLHWCSDAIVWRVMLQSLITKTDYHIRS